MAGNIKVIKPINRYEPINKGIIFDNDVDVLALGLFVRVITFCDKWQLNIKGLSSTLNISEDKVRRCIAVLEKAGYLKRERVQAEGGKFTGWDYTFYNSTDIAKTPTSENTDIGKNRPSENGDMYNINSNLNTNNNSKQETIKNARFDFRQAIIGLGISESTADQWISVRKAKRAVNTEIAFNEISRELAKVQESPEALAQYAVSHSWAGFKAEWYENAQTDKKKAEPESNFAYMMRLGEKMFGHNNKDDYAEEQ